MKPPPDIVHPSARLLKGLAAAGVAISLLGLAACGKQEDTPGQKLDKAIEQTQQAASEAVSAMREMASDASRAASEAATSAGEAIGDAKLDTDAATHQAKEKLRQAEAEAREAASAIRDGASEAATAVRRATSDAAAVVDDAFADTAISTRIRTDFARDSELSAIDIGVETNNGVVTLRGEVPTAAARTRAENLAKTAKGVKSVQNELTVR
jgi:osmotically-inducible protein OsmY